MNKVLDVPILDMSSSAGRRRLDVILTHRGERDDATLEVARRILESVRRRGDVALIEYTRRFDKVTLTRSRLRVTPAEIARSAARTPAALRTAIREAAKRIRAYHERQGLAAFSLRTAEGTLRQMVRPLGRVGLYVPGGHTVYPSTVLMNVIPAQVAGVAEIAVVTPPRDGLAPALAFALQLLGISEVYRVGGAQAIAALAFGTGSIRPVQKIVGPGRSVVALAKRLVYGTVDIDMMAGPSEVVVVTDAATDARLVALDLLAQAEHGSGDEVAVCITERRSVAAAVAAATEAEAAVSPVADVLGRLTPGAVCVCITASRRETMALANRLAPEHLQLMTASCERDLRLVQNAGAVFLGSHSPVALGDYLVGTNHVLPTGGAARFASALGVDDFQKRISVARVSPGGLRRVARHVSAFARAERFVHHALSVERRAGIGAP
jgi:histidinol dehydrogenase